MACRSLKYAKRGLAKKNLDVYNKYKGLKTDNENKNYINNSTYI